ncbi:MULTISPECIES: DUF3348 domain-containing protein [unclassified Lysobacter]
MAKAPPRTPVPGPAFIRLLVRLTDADIQPSRHTLSDRLSQWIDWNRAVGLSRALDGRVPAAATEVPDFDGSEASECTRVRTALVKAIDQASAAVDTGASGSGVDDALVDYTAVGGRYLDMQRTMQAATGRLRGQLRDRLTHETVDLARLAEVDAVMEQTLSPRENTLLATVPALLGQHFFRLHAAGQSPLADPEASAVSSAVQPGAWLERFHKDMQGLLLAELELRFHPVEGLLAALRTR